MWGLCNTTSSATFVKRRTPLFTRSWLNCKLAGTVTGKTNREPVALCPVALARVCSAVPDEDNTRGAKVLAIVCTSSSVLDVIVAAIWSPTTTVRALVLSCALTIVKVSESIEMTVTIMAPVCAKLKE
jgi:hypothetical protein